MPLKVSQRGAIPPFIVMDVMQAAAEREAEQKAVFHLEVGQPGTPAPQGVLDAARCALDKNRLGYTVAMGIPELREAIAAHYARTYRYPQSPLNSKRPSVMARPLILVSMPHISSPHSP